MGTTKREALAGLEFLEAAYAWEREDGAWLRALVETACRQQRHSLWGYGYFYDASNPDRLRG